MQQNMQQNHPTLSVIADLMACSAALLPSRHRLPLICYESEPVCSLAKSASWRLITQLQQAFSNAQQKDSPSQVMETALILSDGSLDESNTDMSAEINAEKSSYRLLKTAQYRQLLGQEWPLIVIDALYGVRANALAAAVGAVKAGGFLVIVAPPESDWPGAACDESTRLFGKATSERSLFIERIQQTLHNYGLRYNTDTEQLRYREQDFDDNANDDNPNIAAVIERIVSEACPTGQSHIDTSALDTSSPDEKPSRQDLSDNPFAEQRAAIEQICRVFTGHPRRPLVLTADRGRGKSSALGMAAARVVNQTGKRLLVTAPTKAAIAELMRWYQQNTDNNLADSLQFCLPEDLLSHGNQLAQSFDGLLVDEAAGIPASLLTLMVKTFNRVVLSTTVQGYEGTGRGFEIRFKQTLNQLRPQWRQAYLHQPIRWGSGDPLEAWSNHALLLEHSVEQSERLPIDLLSTESLPAELLQTERQDPLPDPKLNLSTLVKQSQCQLVKPYETMDENTIKAAFGLLVDSHYQTTPDDFRQFLDHPNRYLFIQKIKNSVVGVALILQEGEIPSELIKLIQQGKRRLRGHLVAQSLAFHMNQPQLAEQKAWRIQRIAIQHNYRRCGLGKSLLHSVEQTAEQMQVHYLSSSFAASEDLVPFWFEAAFKPVRLGLTRDPASGCHSLMVVKPLMNESNHEPVGVISDNAPWKGLYQQFYQTTRLLAASSFCDVSPVLMAQLLSRGVCPQVSSSECPQGSELKNSLKSELTDNTKALLQCFIAGERSFEDSALAIESLLINRLKQSNSNILLSSMAQLIAKLWQGQSTQQWCHWFDASGKKNMAQRLRQATKQLLDDQ
ncbi:GNAT family N-acetyltransferase [Pleionea mediterranea]|uniref:tRNA-binding protein n=1 Tax=Pleionea mediterranea TaxID=523701 RepID=A0A316F8M7_9GAMM|nr:GNAT family N-acetyltransferase [Pleionea mediterranea]PWK43599.1 tRNA-binding protein [Pleionea mediterranea]